MAPTLLPYQHALIETISQKINAQDKEIELRAQRKTGKAMGASLGDERFYLNLLRLEMERVKYMLKSYLRVRILKI